MANFYCDISAIGNEYQDYADTPTTWGVPQDGNGKAGPGHSAAVAIATIDCTSAQGDGAQTLSILGVTVSDASAGSGTTLAASLVTSINATATATTATYCQALLPLNKLVFARQNPGAMAQVQIMLRIAGTDWNGIPTTHAGFTTGPTIADFTGGANGPFGYFINQATTFGKTVGLYGVFAAKSAGITEPGAADIINVRTRRTTDLTANLGDATLTQSFVQHNFVYDDGTVWTGESGVFTLYYNNPNSGANRTWTLVAQTHVCKVAYNFVFNIMGLGTGVLNLQGNDLSMDGMLFDRVKFEDSTSLPSAHSGWRPVSGSFIFNECWIKVNYARQLANLNGAYRASFLLNECKFTAVNMSSKWTSFVVMTATGGGNGDVRVEFRGGEFDSANAFGADAPVTGTPASGNVRVIFDSVRNLDFSVAGFAASTRNGMYTFLYVSADENRQYRYECGTHILDWRAGASYPTLNSLLPSGSFWCQRLLWQVGSGYAKPVYPLKAGVFYRGTEATRKVELDFLCPNTFTPNRAEIGMVVRYQDANGIIRHESTRQTWAEKLSGTANALDSSSASWTGTPGGYSPKKLSLTTSQPVKTNTEVVVTLELIGSPVSQQVLYFNPEPSVVAP